MIESTRCERKASIKRAGKSLCTVHAKRLWGAGSLLLPGSEYVRDAEVPCDHWMRERPMVAADDPIDHVLQELVDRLGRSNVTPLSNPRTREEFLLVAAHALCRAAAMAP